MLRVLLSMILSTCLVSSAWGDKVSAQLVPERSTVQAGAEFRVAIKFKIEDGWHMYWLNPGDSGLAPTVEWTTPEGVKLSTDLHFPPPHRIDAGGGVESFGYEKELVVIADGKIDPSVTGPVKIDAKLTWLVCKEVCLSESASSSVTLSVGEASAADPRFAAWATAVASDVNQRKHSAFYGVRLNKDQSGGVIFAYVSKGTVEDPSRYDLFPPTVEFAAFEKPKIVTDKDGTAITVPFRVLPGMTEPIRGNGMLVTTDKDGRREGLLIPFTFDFRK